MAAVVGRPIADAICEVLVIIRVKREIKGVAGKPSTNFIPMLPERLSTDLTSLNYHEYRPAMIIEMVIGAGGIMQGSKIYRARVRNQAKLAYNSVAAWLEAKGPMPATVAAVPGLAENLRLQQRKTS